MAKDPETVDIKITSAVAIGGKVVKPGRGKASEVTVPKGLAQNLLQRGKAELLTADNKSGGKGEAAEKAAAEKAGDKG